MRKNKPHIIRLSRRDIAPLKKATSALVHERCAQLAAFYGVSYRSIYVGSARTRWGSCSARGNLTFNYKLAGLPRELAEYILVHEICHLLELNHSKQFWEQVARQVPEHKALRKELRRMFFSFR